MKKLISMALAAGMAAALEENGIGHGPCCVLEMF